MGIEPTTHGLSIEVTLQITTTISKEGKAGENECKPDLYEVTLLIATL
jgi:hypothetical protein